MTKQELIDKIQGAAANEGELSKKDIDLMLKVLADVVVDAAKHDDEVVIPGLGKFTRKETAARTGRNPRTGEAMDIPAKTSIAFKVAKPAKDQLN